MERKKRRKSVGRRTEDVQAKEMLRTDASREGIRHLPPTALEYRQRQESQQTSPPVHSITDNPPTNMGNTQPRIDTGKQATLQVSAVTHMEKFSITNV